MNMGKSLSRRPAGTSSRVRLARGPRTTWVAQNGQTVRLPLIVDHVNIDPESGECTWCIEARVDLVDDMPHLTDTRLSGKPCLDPVHLQRFFRWATPVEIVRLAVPRLLASGIDPYTHEFPTDGYPDAAAIIKNATNALSDDFLEQIAGEYVVIGHGYARTIARQRGVSERTVVSWVQKARERGILAQTTPGRRTREVVPREQRRRARSTKKV